MWPWQRTEPKPKTQFVFLLFLPGQLHVMHESALTMLKSPNPKSTERLIESDGSIEDQIVVPPLDLSKCRQSVGSTHSESSPITTTDKKHRIVVVDQADIHRADEPTAPTPAARNSVVSGRRMSSETSIIQLEDEKLITPAAMIQPARRTVKSQAMNLMAMAPEIKPRLKRTLFGDDGAMNETTSFITNQSDSDGTHCTNGSHQSDGSRANEPAADKKSSDAGDETTGHVQGKEIGTDSSISVTLHSTSPLRFDATIRAPRVRLSIFDSVTGQQLRRRSVSDAENIDASILSHRGGLNASK